MTPHPHYDTEVLIVGAGPTGLALAVTLKRAGIEALVVDRQACLQNTSRAAVLHAHTLETLDELGVTPRILSEGRPVSTFSLRDRDQTLMRLKFDGLPSPHACLLMLPQDRTEHILHDALRQAGGDVRWQTRYVGLDQTDSGVDVTLDTAAGIETLRARYVVGADGMQSRVREAAGVGFAGHTYAESFVLADVDLDWTHGNGEVMLFFSVSGMLVVAPLPGGRFRMVATLDHAPAEPGIEDMQALLDTRGPGTPGKVTAVHWSSRFRLHHRVAEHYRAGRMLLVGDAAHVHSPAGGQGMNTGLVDAVLLGKMLAEVVSGRRTPAYLDGYEAQRRPAALEVLSLSARLTRAATLKSAPARALRNLGLRLVGRIPPLRRRIEMSFSGLSRRSAATMPDDAHRFVAGTAGKRGESTALSQRRLAKQDAR